MLLFVVLVVAGFIGILYYGRRYKSIGTTVGVCVEVKTEFSDFSGMRDMQDKDPRSYRPYIKYTWQGREYIAESFFSYGTAKYFPGDTVTVAVNDKDKSIVKILN